MPSYRVEGTEVSLDTYDAVGIDGNEQGFIAHAGIAKNAGMQSTDNVAILDMGPPLHGTGATAHASASVVGSAILTDDEARKIENFIARHAIEHESFLQLSGADLIRNAPQIYYILPHVEELKESDGRYARTRFSCAGFVLEAYRKARIELLDIAKLPPVKFEQIKAAYPVVRVVDRAGFELEELGLSGDGPWPVLLCGYLFHSLNRESDEIRATVYEPKPEDSHFH